MIAPRPVTGSVPVLVDRQHTIDRQIFTTKPHGLGDGRVDFNLGLLRDFTRHAAVIRDVFNTFFDGLEMGVGI